MFDKMKQIMEMKKQADKIKRELDSTSVECDVIKGIKVVINGSQDVRSIEIEDEFFSAQSRQSLEKDLQKAVNAAIKQSQQLAAQKMKEVMPGLPGM